MASRSNIKPVQRMATKTYPVEFCFEKDDGGYHVFAPDLPGLHTFGRTMAEAEANAREAGAAYLESMVMEGEAIPALGSGRRDATGGNSHGVVRKTIEVEVETKPARK